MIHRSRALRITTFLFPVLLVGLALWIALAPKDQHTVVGKVQNLFNRMDDIRYDLKVMRWIGRNKINKSPIVIVGIDRKSMLQEGQWPWRYGSMVRLIAKLREQGASVIALDLIFSQEEKNIVTVVKDKLTNEHIDNSSLNKKLEKIRLELDDNNHLIEQVKNKNDIVLSFLLNTHKATKLGLLPKPILTLSLDNVSQSTILGLQGYITNFNSLQRVSANNGFITSLIDRDGILRREALVARYNNMVYPSLALAVAKVLYPEKKITLNTLDIGNFEYLKSIQFGDIKIQTDKNGQIWIPFHKKGNAFKYFSASDVLHSRIKPNELDKAIVFVGSTVSGFTWLNKTPFNTLISNVEVQAILLGAILEGKFLYTPYWEKAFMAGIIILMGVFLAVILPFLSTTSSIILVFALQCLSFATNAILFFGFGIVISFSLPLFMGVILIVVNVISGFIFESSRKAYLRKSFAQYVPPDYLRLLLENPKAYSFAGKSAELTVLFADIRHFTTISENLDASGVKKLLNKFFTPMTSIILNHGGTIDKYVGDMIMAFWGAPIENTRHVEAAIDASLDMLAKTKSLEKVFHAHGLPEVELGIGLNSGQMNVGDMGSKFRRSYTVIGDAVNLGSRLQGATAFYGVKLLVGSATRLNQAKFIFRQIDKVKFKGKHEAVDIYEVVCRKSDATAELMQEIEEHAKALDAYFSKDWSRALKLFKRLVNTYPRTKVYVLFLERIEGFQKSAPLSSWDGAYEFKEK
jgi:adenylate cyclase